MLNIQQKLNNFFAKWKLFTNFVLFSRNERLYKVEHHMGVIEQEIVNQAIGVIQEKVNQLSIRRFTGEVEPPFDTMVSICDHDFNCVVANDLTATLFLRKQKEVAGNGRLPILYIIRYVSPRFMDELCAQGINFLDCAGNCYLHCVRNGQVVLHVQNKGEKNERPKDRQYPLFQEAGIKLILFLLQDAHNITLSFRKIQEATGVSLGSVKNVIDELDTRGFILNTKEGRSLRNKEELLEKWAENYNLVMRPKLLMGRMKFRSADDAEKWKELKLPDGMWWGGEGAAHLLDSYLTPGAFTVYTEITTARLMESGKVQFDDKGNIEIYKKFWKDASVPPAIIYADLLQTNNSRCIEVAQRLTSKQNKNGITD
jgi:hypothetical protein